MKTSNWTTHLMWVYIAAIVVVTASGMWYSVQNVRPDGIHAHESGNAVYVAGEACTINMTPSTQINMELNRLYIWCTLKHLDYLEEENK